MSPTKKLSIKEGSQKEASSFSKNSLKIKKFNKFAPTMTTKKTANIIQGLNELQKRLKAPKSNLNKFGGYYHRSAEDILEAIKPLIPEDHAIYLTEELQHVGERYYVKATAIFTNGSESIQVSSFAREEEIKKGMDSSQITGSATSYARKYALGGLLLIDDTKDSDATNTHEKAEASKPAQKPITAPANKPAPASPVTAQLMEMTQDILDMMVKRYNNGELDILQKAQAKFSMTEDQIQEFKKAIKYGDK
jgi:hypothetical protein